MKEKYTIAQLEKFQGGWKALWKNYGRFMTPEQANYFAEKNNFYALFDGHKYLPKDTLKKLVIEHASIIFAQGETISKELPKDIFEIALDIDPRQALKYHLDELSDKQIIQCINNKRLKGNFNIPVRAIRKILSIKE